MPRLEISWEDACRFGDIHKKLGFKTERETFRYLLNKEDGKGHWSGKKKEE